LVQVPKAVGLIMFLYPLYTVSTKADLIQQNEDLSSMKNELTEEVCNSPSPL